MKKPNLFIAVIDEPFYGGGLYVLGKLLRDYAYDAVKSASYKIFPCEGQIEQPADGYLAVVYADMPLVSIEVIESTVNTMEQRRIGRFGIGKGYIINTSIENYRQKYSVFSDDFLSVKDASSLNIVYNKLKQISIDNCLKRGAQIFGSPEIDFTAVIEKDAVIEDGCKIKGNSVIKSGARIGIGSEITDSVIMEDAYIRHSVVDGSTVGKATKIGAFALLRQNTVIGGDCRIGDFVEIKNSTLGSGVKSAHLAYIGDATVGDNVNVGCGSIFCNFNGKIKQHIEVGNNVFIGANVNLIAPLKLNDNSYIAAGTTVTDEVGVNEFCIARPKQINKPRKDIT